MELRFFRVRFRFLALESVHFPAFKSANIFRGAFGDIFRRVACDPACPEPAHCPLQGACVYEQIFAPIDRHSPASRFRDLPRPLVFRAAHLDGLTLPASSQFHLDVHVFDANPATVAFLCLAFQDLATYGLGPRRARTQLLQADLLDLHQQPLRNVYPSLANLQDEPLLCNIVLPPPAIAEPQPSPAANAGATEPPIPAPLDVRFITPTELKHAGALVPDPPAEVLMARIFDRIESLSISSGSPVDPNFLMEPTSASSATAGATNPQPPFPVHQRSTLLRAARQLHVAESRLQHVQSERESSRTGRRHPLGGQIGVIRYQGPSWAIHLLLPWLAAACYTGIGRQTVWGKGQMEYTTG